jgi:hypothetical protein
MPLTKQEHLEVIALCNGTTGEGPGSMPEVIDVARRRGAWASLDANHLFNLPAPAVGH